MSKLWADEILDLSQAELASTTRFSPFIPHPESGRLLLLNEGIRRTPRDSARALPSGPSPRWLPLAVPDGDHEFAMWCPLGGEEILRGKALPGRLIGEGGGRLELNPAKILGLVGTGRAFVFAGDLFLLPSRRFDMNSFVYELADREHLGVFIGFRGHDRRYDEILAPSLMRRDRKMSRDRYRAYKGRETFAANAVKEAFWRRDGVALSDIQARGILQHHKVIGDTDILDLAFDVEVAKWFALHRWDRARGRYVKKTFVENADTQAALDETSFVYEVVVRILGDSRVPAFRVRDTDVRLLSWNLSFLWSTRPAAQTGFGLWGTATGDLDMHGAVLNVVERRYHPACWPDGWNAIGGPAVTIGGRTFGIDDDASGAQDVLFPREEPWFEEMLDSARDGLAARRL